MKSEKLRAKWRKFSREYRAKNKEKIKQQVAKHWDELPEKEKQRRIERNKKNAIVWRAKNKDKIRGYRKKQRDKDRERSYKRYHNDIEASRAEARARYQRIKADPERWKKLQERTTKWREKNKEKINEYKRQYRLNNIEYIKAYFREYHRLRKKSEKK